MFASQPDGLRVFVLDTVTNDFSLASRIDSSLTDRYQVDVGRTRAAALITPALTGAVPGIGPARVAVVSSSGLVGIVTLDQIREGATNTPTGSLIFRPSLVADPTRDHAYVVGAISDPVADINLRTLTVSYRRPFASVDESNRSGAERSTAWVGNGRFVVAGWDDGTPGYWDSALLGLRIVDTRTWQTRTLDPDTDFVCGDGRVLVGHHLVGTLAVFLDGVLHQTVVPIAFPVPVASNGRYLYLPAPPVGVDVVDLATGRDHGLPLQNVDEILSPAYTLGAGCR